MALKYGNKFMVFKASESVEGREVRVDPDAIEAVYDIRDGDRVEPLTVIVSPSFRVRLYTSVSEVCERIEAALRIRNG